ncbi:MAG: lactate utilization protein [Halobacteriota archaeon]|nr:lactate utilization protein [Halobacteriota archaeon]
MEELHPEFKDGEEKYNELIANQVLKSLKKNGIKGRSFKTSEEAVDWLITKLPQGGVVGVGGSRTLFQTGLIDNLIKLDKSEKIKFINRWAEGISPKDEFQTRYDNLSADVFLASTNAITLDGKLINIDGMGNRLAAMMFGPKKVYFLVGRNKIVRNVEEGIDRVRNVAAPKNAIRYKLKLPCTETGSCDEPNCHGGRICNFTLIIERGFNPARMTVLLIDEDLGY